MCTAANEHISGVLVIERSPRVKDTYVTPTGLAERERWVLWADVVLRHCCITQVIINILLLKIYFSWMRRQTLLLPPFFCLMLHLQYVTPERADVRKCILCAVYLWLSVEPELTPCSPPFCIWSNCEAFLQLFSWNMNAAGGRGEALAYIQPLISSPGNPLWE